jgi:hypothetical protein
MSCTDDAGEDDVFDLVAAEADSSHAEDQLAVVAHRLLSAVSTALHSLGALERAATPDSDRADLQRIIRRQLDFVDARLRELVAGLPAGSMQPEFRRE